MSWKCVEKRAAELTSRIACVLQPAYSTSGNIIGGDKEVLDIQYKLLGVTDQKARGLLTTNGLTIAIVGLFWKSFDFSVPTAGDIYIFMMFPLASSILCMWAIRIDWLFYQKIEISTCIGSNLVNQCNLREEIKKLSEVIVKRYYLYQIAWLISFGLFSFILLFIFAFNINW